MIPYIKHAVLSNSSGDFSLDITYTVYNNGDVNIKLESQHSGILVKENDQYLVNASIFENMETSNKEAKHVIHFKLGTRDNDIEPTPVNFDILVSDGGGEEHKLTRSVNLKQNDLETINED